MEVLIGTSAGVLVGIYSYITRPKTKTTLDTRPKTKTTLDTRPEVQDEHATKNEKLDDDRYRFVNELTYLNHELKIVGTRMELYNKQYELYKRREELRKGEIKRNMEYYRLMLNGEKIPPHIAWDNEREENYYIALDKTRNELRGINNKLEEICDY